jgi:hypothetical protein
VLVMVVHPPDLPRLPKGASSRWPYLGERAYGRSCKGAPTVALTRRGGGKRRSVIVRLADCNQIFGGYNRANRHKKKPQARVGATGLIAVGCLKRLGF